MPMGLVNIYARRIVAGALLAVLLTACAAPAAPGQTPSTTTVDNATRVTRGTIRTVVSASGNVASQQEVLLNFTSGSTVRVVNVAVGQRVKQDDPLGSIDTRDLEFTLAQQEANVVSAQAKYDNTAAGSTQKDIDIAQANVDSAKAKYQATATTNPKDIDVARANLNSALAAYQSVATINPKDIQVARANLDSAIAKYNAVVAGTTTPQDIANAEASLRSAQAKLDSVRAGSNKADIISAQNKLAQQQQNLEKVKSDSANTKEQARITWEKSADATRSAQRSFDIANATYQQALQTNTDPSGSGAGTTGTATTKVATITPLKLATYKQQADAAYLTVQQAEKTQEGNRLTYENAKQAEMTNITTAQQQLNDSQTSLSKLLQGPTQEDVTQAQSAVDQAKSALDKLKRGPTDTDIASAQASIDSARATLNDLLAGPKPADLAKAQASVDSARATLNDLLNGPKSTDLAQAQATVNSAQATLTDLTAGPKATDLTTALATLNQAKAQRDLSKLNLDKASIKAPFAGVLTQVNVVPGQIAAGTATNPNFDLVDDSTLHIDVNISEIDSSNVKIGQTVTVTLDSVQGQPTQGTVERVNPVATTTSNVTAFIARITLVNPAAGVRPGATATVQIQTNIRQNVLTVPTRAVTQVNGQPAVTVAFRNSTFLVPVRTGLSDGRNTEILDGLSEGDEIVVPKAGSGAGGAAPGAGGPPGR